MSNATISLTYGPERRGAGRPGAERVRCDCPGAGHDPTICASTEHLCRYQEPGMNRICGMPKGHEGEHYAD